MHPMKATAEKGHNAKLRAMTSDYQSDSGNPTGNRPAPVARQKTEGPEDAVGFGADSDMTRARPDRATRARPRAMPVATLARGGRTHRADGGPTGNREAVGIASRDVNSDPAMMGKSADEKQEAIGRQARGIAEMARRTHGGRLLCAEDGGPVGSVGPAHRARGGRLGKKGGKGHTNVNVIVAPHSGNTPPEGAVAGPPPPAVMPRPPMAAPPGGPPMGGPPPGGLGPAGPLPGGPPIGGAPMGGPPPGMLPPRKRGGRVHDDEAEDKALIEKTLKEEGLKRAHGGVVHAGGHSGMGRLEKIGKMPSIKHSPPQAV